MGNFSELRVTQGALPDMSETSSAELDDMLESEEDNHFNTSYSGHIRKFGPNWDIIYAIVSLTLSWCYNMLGMLLQARAMSRRCGLFILAPPHAAVVQSAMPIAQLSCMYAHVVEDNLANHGSDSP